MKVTIAQRIRQYLDNTHLSINAASKITGVGQVTLNRQLNGSNALSIESLEAFANSFPLLSAEWLLRGHGEMTTTTPAADKELQEVCIDQAKEIFRLKQRIAELEGEKKDRA